MKSIFFLFVSITFLQPDVFSQQNTAITRGYLDAYEKPAAPERAIYLVKTYKRNPTDSTWQMELFFKRVKAVLAATGQSLDSGGSIRHGLFEYYYDNKKISRRGSYANNKKEGPWQEWNDEGKTVAQLNYIDGHLSGLNLRWFKSGKISDSTVLDINGNGTASLFYDDGGLHGKGTYKNGKKDGEWNFYYPLPGGKKCMEATLQADTAVSLVCYAVDGTIRTDDCIYEKEAFFPGEIRAWSAYLVKSLERVKAEKYLQAGERYTILVRFIIDTDGMVADVKVENPNFEKLDEKAAEIIKNSPRWVPAVQYGRKVKAYRRQPVTFAVE